MRHVGLEDARTMAIDDAAAGAEGLHDMGPALGVVAIPHIARLGDIGHRAFPQFAFPVVAGRAEVALDEPEGWHRAAGAYLALERLRFVGVARVDGTQRATAATVQAAFRPDVFGVEPALGAVADGQRGAQYPAPEPLLAR